MVQAWGDGGRQPAERAALEWLETCDLPEIEATPHVFERDAAVVYVPPNDPGGGDLSVLPDRRRRQERTFRAIVPAEPIVRYRWSATPSPEQRSALGALAARVASIGHSTSLVRCAFVDHVTELDPEKTWRPDVNGAHAFRAPYSGRFADLERWFGHGVEGAKTVRPGTRFSARYRGAGAPGPGPIPQSVFGGENDWIVFEDFGGDPPDLLAFAHVARRVRDTFMAVGPKPIPEIISGHAPGGGRGIAPHMAILPLANLGWEHSTGDLLGFAICLPRGASKQERWAVFMAVAGFVTLEGDLSYGTLNITREHAWRVERSPIPSRASTRPARWCRASKTWASATPVMLDRFTDNVLEEARSIAAACTNIGLPEPVDIEIHKHSAVRGAPSAYPARGVRHRPDWSFPRDASFKDRPRRHVVIRFESPVEGPVLLGAGRFYGFGLCLPMDKE